jgi:transposase
MSKTEAKKRRRFTSEYKAEVVRLCRESNKSPHAVAKELGLTPSSVLAWVRQAEIDAGGGGQGSLTTEERAELAALRRENRVLRQEREILKRATAFFAKEGTS